MAKKRLSRDQKRKAKLTARARKTPAPLSLAYSGNKFKRPELTPLMLEIESGVFQAHVLTGRKLTDQHVRSAMERLVLQMRSGGLPEEDHDCEVHYAPGEEVELVVWSIRHNWDHFFERSPHPGNETLTGVLRTLLDSVETWSTPGPLSRGYLNYLEGFLAKAGIRFEIVNEDGEEAPEAEDEFLDVGSEWCETGHERAREQFLKMADDLIAAGEWERVSNTAQRLIGEYPLGPVKELSTLSVRAQKTYKQLPHNPAE